MATMEILISKHAKGDQRSAKVPLLPISHNPHSKSPHIIVPATTTSSHATPSIAKFTIVLFVSLIALSVIAFSPLVRKETSLGPQAPMVQLAALSVHRLNVSDTNLTAEWDVTLKIKNPNYASYMWFDRMEAFVLYEDTPLAIETVEPFGLAMRMKNELRLKFKMVNWEGVQPALKEGVLKKMKRDRQLGGVRFSVQMAVWATYRSGWWWSGQHVIMNPQCLDLQVGFVPGASAIGFGILMGDVPRMCYVPMLAE